MVVHSNKMIPQLYSRLWYQENSIEFLLNSGLLLIQIALGLCIILTKYFLQVLYDSSTDPILSSINPLRDYSTT